MKNRIILTIFTAFLSMNLFAQKAYTLNDCKEIAQKNNSTLKNSTLRIADAEQSKKEAFTNYFPVVNASAFGFKNNKPLYSMNFGTAQIEVLKSGIVAGVTAIQPIYSGGKIYYGNKLSKVGLEMSQYQHQVTKNGVLLEVEKDYWQIVSLTEKLKTVQSIGNSLDTLFKKVKLSNQAGFALSNEVLRVKLKQNETDASLSKISNGIILAKMALCQQMGLPMDSATQLEVATPDFGRLVSPIDFVVEHENVVSDRPEYKMLNKNVTIAQLETKIKRSEYLPSVAVGINYGYDNLIKGSHLSGMAFATLSIPISEWWGGSYALKKQQIKERIAENEYREGKDLLLLEMRQIQNELNESFRQIQISELSVKESTENLRLNTDYYNAGTVDLTAYLDAQTLLVESKNKYIDACIEYLINKTKYSQVTAR